MLIILGGVQASGKTTILSAIKEAYPDAIELPRSQPLREALIESPRDIGTTNHLNVLYRVLNCWDDILQEALGDTNQIYLLDAGPITTIAYNCLTLETALRDDASWAHYYKTRVATESPYQKILDRESVAEVLESCKYACRQYLRNSFNNVALTQHRTNLAIYLHTSAETITKRFGERRNDIRVNNMQNWFVDKQAEIDTYTRAYKFAADALEGRTNNPLIFSTQLTSGSVEETVSKTLEEIRHQRYCAVGQ